MNEVGFLVSKRNFSMMSLATGFTEKKKLSYYHNPVIKMEQERGEKMVIRLHFWRLRHVFFPSASHHFQSNRHTIIPHRFHPPAATIVNPRFFLHFWKLSSINVFLCLLHQKSLYFSSVLLEMLHGKLQRYVHPGIKPRNIRSHMWVPSIQKLLDKKAWRTHQN